MGKSLLVLVLLFSFDAAAKSSNADSTKYQRGLLKKISCVFSGVKKTSVGDPITSIDFPADPANTVCDPLANEESSSSPENGLLGKLILRTPEMGSKVSSVMDYYYKGHKLDQNLYFGSVNIPTRPFDQGFTTLNGDVLVDTQGNKLIENFAVEYTSSLKLSDADKEGDYELAILSDDGARVFVKEGAEWKELINNDGVHPTRMGCANRTINLKRDSEVPVKILYYQGPRYHIANVLVWKFHKKPQTWKKPDNHSFCGITSNTFFFDKKGKKTAAMGFLEKTGWRVLAAANYKMPDQQRNPCTVPDLALSEYKVVSAAAPNATLSWKTNLPASSQLRIYNVYTGEEVYSAVDSNLVTEHTVQVSGLVRGIYYQMQAISVDEKGREIRSDFIDVLP